MTGGVAVILGSTGRNLGAGMSGGVAYVHDLRPQRVNSDALDTGELTLMTLDDDDREIVSELLRRHREETESALAARLIADGDAALDRFVKVMPRDYAAVLATRQTALDEGLDPDGDVVWGRILEVTGG